MDWVGSSTGGIQGLLLMPSHSRQFNQPNHIGFCIGKLVQYLANLVLIRLARVKVVCGSMQPNSQLHLPHSPKHQLPVNNMNKQMPQVEISSQEPRSSLLSKLWKRKSSSASSSDEGQNYQHLQDGLVQWHLPAKAIAKSMASLSAKPTESCATQLKRIAGVSVTTQQSHGDLLVALEVQLQRPEQPLSGGLYQPGRRQLRHQVTRPFAEFRTLRKAIALSLKQSKCQAQACAFCSDLSAYVKTCWEQPPLVVAQRSTGGTVFRDDVLAKSMMSMVEYARSESPDCQAHRSFVLALWDFLRLDELDQRAASTPLPGSAQLSPPSISVAKK